MVWRPKNGFDPVEYATKWRKENKDKIYAAQKRWRQKNPDKYYANIQKYRARHPEKIKEIQNKYNKEHKEQIQISNNERRNKYFSTTIEWNFLNRCIARRKSAKKKYTHFTEHKHDIDKYTFRELLEKQNGICPLTGVSLILRDTINQKDYFIYEIDHIIPCNQPGSYHGKDNLQLVFPYVNSIKWWDKET